jgi:hypothetical protein
MLQGLEFATDGQTERLFFVSLSLYKEAKNIQATNRTAVKAIFVFGSTQFLCL